MESRRAISRKMAFIAHNVKLNEPMSKHTSFSIGGAADFFIEADSMDQIREVSEFTKQKKMHLYVIGSGTNILVSDKGIRGVVLKLGRSFSDIAFRGEDVIAGASCHVQVLVKKVCEQGLRGLEFAVGIPGTVGGAIVSNAGAYSECFGDIIKDVTVIDKKGNVLVLQKDSIDFGYRRTSLPSDYIVLSTTLGLKNFSKDAISEKVRLYRAKRRNTQPVKSKSAGCIFKNHSLGSAGSLIESAGLKSLRHGDAEISSLHANYIVNLGKATAYDVMTLIEDVQTKISEMYHIDLELEISIIGE